MSHSSQGTGWRSGNEQHFGEYPPWFSPFTATSPNGGGPSVTGRCPSETVQLNVYGPVNIHFYGGVTVNQFGQRQSGSSTPPGSVSSAAGTNPSPLSVNSKGTSGSSSSRTAELLAELKELKELKELGIDDSCWQQ